MRKVTLVIAATILLAVPIAALATVPIIHTPFCVYQAYTGCSMASHGSQVAGETAFTGYAAPDPTDLITAVPGILYIEPGCKWSNFVLAAQQGVSYTLKNVSLVKDTPCLDQGADVFPAQEIQQHGTPCIRLWWPLEYEVPGTTWTLTITYGTQTMWKDSATNPPAYVHTEVWEWVSDASLYSMFNEIDLFHEIAEGTNEVPLISDEVLYCAIQDKLTRVLCCLKNGDTLDAGLLLVEFEDEISDEMIFTSPSAPDPTGCDTGIIEEAANPAAVKLLVDSEYVGNKLGIWLQVKR